MTASARPTTPAVTIVIATYNRSNVLRCTIEGVLAQHFTNWELRVVGDACTDDTAELVASFGDPRIHWHNLAENCGEQSGPNNAGIRAARAPVVALLNHDDLWFPDHLETALGALERSGAELVMTLQARRPDDGPPYAEGVFPNRRFVPGAAPVEASGLVFRRELFDRIGPWRRYTEVYDTPIRDWLQRVWAANAHVEIVPHLTVIAINSTRGSYVDRPDAAHRALLAEMGRDVERLRSGELAELLFGQQQRLTEARLADVGTLSIRELLQALGVTLFHRVARALGRNPQSLRRRLRGNGKGDEIRALRVRRGLDAEPGGTAEAAAESGAS